MALHPLCTSSRPLLHSLVFLERGVTQAFMETNTIPAPHEAARPLTCHMTSAQLPHLPSQDLPDWSPVSPPYHHSLPAFPTADVTGEQGLHPVCSRDLTSGFHPAWEGSASALPIPLDPLCPRAGLDDADENRLWEFCLAGSGNTPSQ